MGKKILVLGAIFVSMVLVVILVNTKYQDAITVRHFTHTRRLRPVSIESVSHISHWMTFDYINKVFDLPPEYLKDTLEIRDTRYPFLTVRQYSQKTNINEYDVIKKVQDEVRLRVSSSSAK